MTATLQSAVDALNAAAVAYNGKIDEINALMAEVQGSAGAYLQVKGENANIEWVVGHGNKFILPLPPVTLVAKGNNSQFDVSGFYWVNDTNENSFGSGIGLDVSIDGGVIWSEVVYPARNAIYQAGANDTYQTNYLMKLWQSGAQEGDTLMFRLTARFNNANAQSYDGNDGGVNRDNMALIVREVAGE